MSQNPHELGPNPSDERDPIDTRLWCAVSDCNEEVLVAGETCPTCLADARAEMDDQRADEIAEGERCATCGHPIVLTYDGRECESCGRVPKLSAHRVPRGDRRFEGAAVNHDVDYRGGDIIAVGDSSSDARRVAQGGPSDEQIAQARQEFVLLKSSQPYRWGAAVMCWLPETQTWRIYSGERIARAQARKRGHVRLWLIAPDRVFSSGNVG